MASAPRELPAELARPRRRRAARGGARRRSRWPRCGAWRASTSSPTATSLFVNEVNTVPGSLARYLWVDPAVPFLDLLDALIDEALARPVGAPQRGRRRRHRVAQRRRHRQQAGLSRAGAPLPGRPPFRTVPGCAVGRHGDTLGRMPFPRRLLTEDEEVVVEIRPHWAFLGGRSWSCVAVVALAIAVMVAFSDAPPAVLYVLLDPRGRARRCGWRGGSCAGSPPAWSSPPPASCSARVCSAATGLELRLERVNQLSYHQSLVDRHAAHG